MVSEPKLGGDSLICLNLNEDLVVLNNPERCLADNSHKGLKIEILMDRIKNHPHGSKGAENNET
jgi:hypothetical protein